VRIGGDREGGNRINLHVSLPPWLSPASYGWEETDDIAFPQELAPLQPPAVQQHHAGLVLRHQQLRQEGLYGGLGPTSAL